MTWFIILMFWNVSGEPHFEPGWHPVEVQRYECAAAAASIIGYAKSHKYAQGDHFEIACIGAYTPEQMVDKMVAAFNIKKGLPI